VNLRQN